MSNSDQPWRCLWRGSVQITRTTPLRRMILQLRQIRFTDASTFMISSLLLGAGRSQPFAEVLRLRRDSLLGAEDDAWVRSSGTSWTVTLSPRSIRCSASASSPNESKYPMLVFQFDPEPCVGEVFNKPRCTSIKSSYAILFISPENQNP